MTRSSTCKPGRAYLPRACRCTPQRMRACSSTTFSSSSFGWGGDPNNALRVRIDKSKWYDFRASFMRDQNYFDYNLLANPLNPPTSSPYMPILFSPHNFETTRRMSNLDLTLLPLSRISFRARIFSQQHDGVLL